jgi:hypothetical protein
MRHSLRAKQSRAIGIRWHEQGDCCRPYVRWIGDVFIAASITPPRLLPATAPIAIATIADLRGTVACATNKTRATAIKSGRRDDSPARGWPRGHPVRGSTLQRKQSHKPRRVWEAIPNTTNPRQRRKPIAGTPPMRSAASAPSAATVAPQVPAPTTIPMASYRAATWAASASPASCSRVTACTSGRGEMMAEPQICLRLWHLCCGYCLFNRINIGSNRSNVNQ